MNEENSEGMFKEIRQKNLYALKALSQPGLCL
jgi:hypothetical protein